MLDKKSKVVTVVLAGLLLLSCQSQPTETKNTVSTNTNAAAPAKADPKVVDEVQQLLKAHDAALNDQNIDAIVATFSSDPKTVVLGTGQGERFVGTEAIRSAYTEIVRDYEKGTLETECDWKEGAADEAGKMAWLAATCQARDSMKGVKREYVLNVSAAVVKEPGGWRFLLLHMSNSPGGPPPPDGKKPEANKPEANKAETKKPEANK